MNRARTPEAEVYGSPHLVVRDEDVDAIAELLADALIVALERTVNVTARNGMEPD